jgi:glycosyltransferase involved in cell wall biosynthesis
MPPRRLLIVTYHFPPSAASGSFRLLGFARHLPKFGWEADVVAPPMIPWEPQDAGLERQVPDATRVERVPYPSGSLSKPLRKVAPYAAWLPSAWPVCRRLIRERRPDALLTSGPPHGVHAAGWLLKRLEGVPWVADFRDPWRAGADDEGRWRLEGMVERRVMREADVIVANAPRASEAVRAAFPSEAAKVVTITNGYDPERFARPVPPGPRYASIRITHLGEIYHGRDPRPFLDAIRGLLGDAVPLRVDFYGRSADSALNLGAEVSRRGLEGIVHDRGQVPYDEALRAMIDSDLLLVLDTPGRRVGIPAKLYEYIGAGRPILALSEPEGDLAWALARSGLPHRIAPPADPGAIRSALAGLIDEAASNAVASPRDDRGPFTRESVARRLAGVLDRCVEGQGRRPATGDRPRARGSSAGRGALCTP